jgi:hypothetical protein
MGVTTQPLNQTLRTSCKTIHGRRPADRSRSLRLWLPYERLRLFMQVKSALTEAFHLGGFRTGLRNLKRPVVLKTPPPTFLMRWVRGVYDNGGSTSGAMQLLWNWRVVTSRNAGRRVYLRFIEPLQHLRRGQTTMAASPARSRPMVEGDRDVQLGTCMSSITTSVKKSKHN